MMVNEKAKELAEAIRASGEYKRFTEAKQAIADDSMTQNLLREYSKLRVRMQAAAVAGEEDPEAMVKLQKLGELLQMDRAASEYLMAEFMLSRMVGDVYKTIASAVDLDLSMLDE